MPVGELYESVGLPTTEDGAEALPNDSASTSGISRQPPRPPGDRAPYRRAILVGRDIGKTSCIYDPSMVQKASA